MLRRACEMVGASVYARMQALLCVGARPSVHARAAGRRVENAREIIECVVAGACSTVYARD
eukprot:3000261-Pleurochrysis_carterae.AAC.1